MPQMLLPMFPSEATSINPLLGFSRRDDMVYYFNGIKKVPGKILIHPVFSDQMSPVFWDSGAKGRKS